MKNTEGVPHGRGLAAPESEFNSRTYPLATANIVTKGEKCGVAMLSREIIRLRVKFFAHYYEQRTVEQITVFIWGG